MKRDILLTPLRDFSTGLIQAQGTGLSFASRIGCILCSSPELTSSPHADSDLADHSAHHRIAQWTSEHSTISPPNIQSP